MLRKLSRSLIVGSLGFGLAACGAARVLQRTQTTGVIELQGDRGKAMEQANQEMAAHCGPNNYTIEREGFEVIGQDTFVREDQATDTKTSRSGRKATTDTTTVQQTSSRDATAWRVHYICGGGGPPAGEPPPGGQPPPPPGSPPPPPGNR